MDNVHQWYNMTQFNVARRVSLFRKFIKLFNNNNKILINTILQCNSNRSIEQKINLHNKIYKKLQTFSLIFILKQNPHSKIPLNTVGDRSSETLNSGFKENHFLRKAIRFSNNIMQ